MRLVALVIFGALVIPGCSDGDAPDTTDFTPSGDGTLVEYSRAGGIAFTSERLVVEADGDATLTVENSPDGPKSRALTLDDGEIEELTALVAGADLDEFEGGDGVCADCYEYEIAANGTTASFSDVDLDTEFAGGTVPEGMTQLLAELSEIVAENPPATG